MAAPLSLRVLFNFNKNMKLMRKVSAICHQQNPILSSQHARPELQLCRYCSQIEREDTDVSDELFKSIVLEMKGHSPPVLNSYEFFIKAAADELDVTVEKIWTPPKVIERYTLLKSVHIYKKHRVQYETRTHFRSIQIKHLTGSTADTFLEYIERNLPEGIAMKITKNRREALPAHLQQAIGARRVTATAAPHDS